MRVKHGPEEGFLARRTSDADGEVIRLKLVDTGEWMAASNHKIAARKCDCTGFAHRKECAHIAALFTEPVTVKPLSLPDARNLADSLLRTFRPGLRLAPESYEWENGQVVGIIFTSKGSPGACAGVVGGVRIKVTKPL